jgi:hypothetical protein
MMLPEWSNSSSKDTLKLGDGESVVGVFRGMPTRFYQHWQNNRSIRCIGRGSCPMCQSENEDVRYAAGRFRMNFAMKRDKNSPWEVLIFENGRKVYSQLEAINRDSPIERTVVRITKTGKGKQSSIMVQVVAGDKGIVTPELDKQLAALKLLPLEDQEPEELEETTSDAPAVQADEDVPF